MALQGDAGFKYTPDASEITVNLEAPLRQIRPMRRKTRFRVEAMDNKTIETITIANSTVHEIRAFLRYSNNQADILKMLSHGADGVTLDYYHSLSEGTKYPSILIEPTGHDIEMAMDRDLGVLGRHEIEIRLRRIDGGTYDGILN